MKPTLTAIAATTLLLLTAAEEPPPPPLPPPADAAPSTGWQAQPGCAWRNHWSDSHHSALSMGWAGNGIALSLISDAFTDWPNNAHHPVELDFGGADARVKVDALATTGEGYAIIDIPYAPDVEQGLVRDSSMRIVSDGQVYVSLDMAGTAEAIAAVKACAAAPHAGVEDGIDAD